MLSGTPILSTNFGVFPETIQERGGIRCNTLADFVEATKKVENLDPMSVRLYAEKYLLEPVSKEFKSWFTDLHNLYESTVDKNKKGLFDASVQATLDGKSFRFEREDYKNLDDLINHLFDHFKQALSDM